MIERNIVFEIHRLFDSGNSMRHIASTLQINRATVTKYLENPLSNSCSRKVRSSILEPYYEYIKYYLRENPQIPATVVFQRLKNRGFGGEITIIRNYLQKERKHFQPKEDFSEDSKEVGYFWILKLLQGKISKVDLVGQFSGKLEPKEIEKLHRVILQQPLKYRNRAITILLYLEKISQRSIARFLFIERETVGSYVKKFKTREIDNLLKQEQRPKKHEDPKYKEALFNILHSPPSSYEINRTTWKMDDLQHIMAEKGFDLCKDGIRKIIKNAGYTVRKAKKVLTSTDPEYREKLKAITEILSNLKPNEKFFSIDEYGPFAIKIQGGKSLLPPGVAKTYPQWQKSKGSLIITAALELSTNQITHFYSEKKNTDEMIKLLNLLVKQYSDEETIYLSWEAASWHASKKLQKRVDVINSDQFKKHTKSPIVKLAPLPKCAQFLNVIESVFSGMARAIIHNSDYQSVEECKSAIDRHFADRNNHFKKHPKRAGNKIWGKERVSATFSESNNCKDPKYR
jgi:transposase